MRQTPHPSASSVSRRQNSGSPSTRGAQDQTKSPRRSIRALTLQLPMGARSRLATFGLGSLVGSGMECAMSGLSLLGFGQVEAAGLQAHTDPGAYGVGI